MKLMFFIKSALLCIHIFSIAEDLAVLAEKYDTDKGIRVHNYISIYEYYFFNLRNKPLNFLEIGFASGASAHMWDAYFSEASLYFIDIESEYFKRYAHNFSSRCKFCVADQGNEKDLENFIKQANVEFDIIIDDGGHRMEQQITSFKILFPYLKSGGIYVIEDLHTSYWSSFGGSDFNENPKSNKNTTVSFLQALVDEVNFIGAATGYADTTKCPENIKKRLSYYQKNIRSIHFYNSLCFILKN